MVIGDPKAQRYRVTAHCPVIRQVIKSRVSNLGLPPWPRTRDGHGSGVRLHFSDLDLSFRENRIRFVR